MSSETKESSKTSKTIRLTPADEQYITETLRNRYGIREIMEPIGGRKK